ncbi:recombinase RecT [Acinetobacter colistiniresistens]|uniref:recombinase RecT n=1 Tax=Acinetobacter colistiniresistens TaxID=280145 RepID=UPI001250A727|nr:recombinase RecT [Acinetobacter colistiniresistens]
MNAQANAVAQQNSSSNQFVGLLNLEAFELSQRVAKMLSSSTLVPEQYRAVTKVKAGKDNNGNWQFRDEPNPSGLSNCVIALNIANRLNADALMVMQNLYIIEGRPAWSSQFIMAAINSCGRFSSLRFELKDLGEKEVEYQETQWNNGRKNIVTKKVKIQDMSCFAWVEEKGAVDLEGKPVILKSSVITVEMAVKEGWYQKNGSKWQTMPEQMLRYRAASFFGRVYAPELLMGLKSEEEERDLIDVTPEPEVVKNTAGQVRALKQKILAAKTTSDLYALGGELADLDDADKSEIQKLFTAQLEKLSVEVVVENVADAEVLENETSAPVEEQKQPQELVNRRQPKDVEKVSSMAIRKDYLVRMNKAETLDDLTKIHDEFLKNEGLTGQHVSYLKDTYMQLKEKLQPAAEAPQAKVETVDPIKSNSVKSGLERMIADANDVISLEAEVAIAIKGSESKMTQAHNQAVLMAYAQRKELLAQQDIFEEKPATLNPVDATIQKIKAANSQDEINTIFTDPAIEQFSEDDMAVLNQAADMRENELQG